MHNPFKGYTFTGLNTNKMNYYSHPQETLFASDFINNNLSSSYLGMKNGHSYYNVNGVVWEAWQSMGTSNLNTRHTVTIKDFN